MPALGSCLGGEGRAEPREAELEVRATEGTRNGHKGVLGQESAVVTGWVLLSCMICGLGVAPFG